MASFVVSWKQLASVQTDPSGNGHVCKPLASFADFIIGPSRFPGEPLVQKQARVLGEFRFLLIETALLHKSREGFIM